MIPARLIFASALLTLAACGQAEQSASTTSSSSTSSTIANGAACSAQTSRDWTIGSATYHIVATAQGAACPEAVATIILRAPSGSSIFTTNHPIAQIPLGFNPNGNAENLQSDLEAWTENVAPGAGADALPAWAPNAERPAHFLPVATREAYETARAQKQPIFCFPDGAESNACVAVDPAAQTAMLLGSLTPERP